MPLDSIFVPKGTRILMGLLKCNTDPDIWGPDAHEWKPERWLSPLPDRVPEAHVPGIYSHLYGLNQLTLFDVLSTEIPFQDDFPWRQQSLYRFQILSARNEYVLHLLAFDLSSERFCFRFYQR